MSASVKVLAFAGARDVIGASEVQVPLESGCTADQLMDTICARFPALAPHRGSLRMAVNGCYVKGDAAVASGDEVALIPPVAGG
jgi:molybdopterin synthase catalytic subunit/molybdopterin synthase sulfur carrier subunit